MVAPIAEDLARAAEAVLGDPARAKDNLGPLRSALDRYRAARPAD